VIIHVVDGSDQAPLEQIAAVREVLMEIDAGEIPELLVINKKDLATDDQILALRHQLPHAIIVSAYTGEGIESLIASIESMLPDPRCQVDLVVPYSRGDLVSRAHEEGDVERQEYRDVGTHVVARVPADLAAELQAVNIAR